MYIIQYIYYIYKQSISINVAFHSISSTFSKSLLQKIYAILVAGTCGYGEGLPGSINTGNFLTSCNVYC
jgi:hypothetical protein